MVDGEDESEPTGAAAPRRLPPTLLEPPTPEPMHNGRPGLLGRDGLLGSQADEADLHQFRVDHGLCWQEDFPAAELLESSAIGFGSLPESLRARVSWTAAQKATFFELLGRKTASALPEIAAQVGKSLLECEAYLEALCSESEHLAIDYGEIPAAEEVPANLVEPDFGGADLGSSARESEKNEHEAGLFVLSRLRAFAGKPVSASAIHALHAQLRQKLHDWVLAIGKITMSGPGVSASLETVLQVIEQDDNDAMFDDSGTAKYELENQGAAEMAFGAEASSAETANETGNGFEDESEAEAKALEMIRRETEWLNKLDEFQSQLALRARAGHDYPGSDMLAAPEMRDSDLEKFMQSR